MRLLSILLMNLFITMTSCHSQQLMQTINEAGKIKENEKRFINKPLKDLLNQVKPPIKAALGDPETTSDVRLNSISFYFANKKEFQWRRKNGEDPTRILVMLSRPNGKTYPKLSPTSPWTKKQTDIYGDMVVRSITILGSN